MKESKGGREKEGGRGREGEWKGNRPCEGAGWAVGDRVRAGQTKREGGRVKAHSTQREKGVGDEVERGRKSRC